MDVDISKWEKIAHDPDGDSTSKRSNFLYENAAASDFIYLGLTIMQINFLIINHMYQ